MASENLPAPLLSIDEDSFCLALIEYNGNLGAAYRSVWPDAKHPIAKARELASRPEVAKRIMQLGQAVNEQSMISLGSHLQSLADIRDQAMASGQLRVALSAEIRRGEVVGITGPNKFNKGTGGEGGSKTTVNVFLPRTPANMTEWAQRAGVEPVVIDVEPK